jgi:hypothetical protein
VRSKPTWLQRRRWDLGWWLLGELGREHVVRHVVDQLAEQEAITRQARAASLRGPREQLIGPRVEPIESARRSR